MPLQQRHLAGSLRRWAGWLAPALALLLLATPSATGASVRPVAIGHGVIDSACRGGAGTVIAAPPSWLASSPSVATTLFPSGIALVVVSSGYPPASFVEAYAFTASCAPDPDFGDSGVERLAFGGRDVSVASATPTVGGGAILAGQAKGGWLVARIDARGRLDPAFGKGGWTVLPWPGGASTVTQAGSGNILVGGSFGAGCCERGWVGELNAHGAIVGGFGSGGRMAIPTLEDSGIARIALEPDGEVLVLTSGGNMGCWSVTVTALTASGSPVPSFGPNFDAAMKHALPSQVFVGDMVVHANGFLLVGTGQKSCVTNIASPTAIGRVIAFRPNGELDTSFASGGEAHFGSPMEDPVWALPQQAGGTLLVGQAPGIQVSARARASLNLVDISSVGTVDQGYGHGGVNELQLPFLSQAYPASAIPVSVTTNGQLSVVVSSTANGKELELVQLPG